MRGIYFRDEKMADEPVVMESEESSVERPLKTEPWTKDTIPSIILYDQKAHRGEPGWDNP